MKIAIVGTRGIPNNYGGFEQLAQYLSLGLKERGHEVFVYSSHQHPYQQPIWQGINIIHKYDPEKSVGAFGQFIYDLNCIRDCRDRNYDIILNLGYTSSSIWLRFLPDRATVITNMDGLEWKRSKYSKKVQRFLMYAERLAVKRSDVLVADSKAIQNYLEEKYKISSIFIAYGAPVFTQPDTSILKHFSVEPMAYSMLIARMEPENNIEMILDGVDKSDSSRPFLVVGNTINKFGNYLTSKFRNHRTIRFTGPIYDEKVINNLRYFSYLYFHGHSVGGTNPSLLEAMGCSCMIAAHDNLFNKSVLQSDALYFESDNEVSNLLTSEDHQTLRKEHVSNNIRRIEEEYSWTKIVREYEQLMQKFK